jgi:anti-sigma regulatory factor (Ser/Thr protein kinase)
VSEESPTSNVLIGDAHRLLRGFAELSFTIHSDEESVVAAVETVRQQMVLLALDEDWIARAELCLQEALLNAHGHGNRGDASKEIRVGCLLSGKKIELHVVDDGPGFDLQPQVKKQRLFGPRGRGLYRIRELMNSVAVSGSHIVLGLCKE